MVIEGFESAGLVIAVTEIAVHKADEPNLIAGLFGADALAGKDRAEINLLMVGADAAACGDGDGDGDGLVARA